MDEAVAIEIRADNSHKALTFGTSKVIFPAFNFGRVKVKNVVEIHVDEMKVIAKMRPKIDSNSS